MCSSGRPSARCRPPESFTDWHLVTVDRGSLDDTAGRPCRAWRGLRAASPVVRESRCSHARALNVALEHGTAEHVTLHPLGRRGCPTCWGRWSRTHTLRLIRGAGQRQRGRSRPGPRRATGRPGDHAPSPRGDQGRRRLRREPRQVGRARPHAPALARPRRTRPEATPAPDLGDNSASSASSWIPGTTIARPA